LAWFTIFENQQTMNVPLAERARPRALSGLVGQNHLLGPGKPLRTAIENGYIPSMIFWGPPGSGKTTLARIVAMETGRRFFTLSAVDSGLKDVRDFIQQAEQKNLFLGEKAPVLFIDEIHRFNKGQQDALLGVVEKGIVVLIGATTENPSFEVNKALLSRCRVFTLNALEQEDLKAIAHRAFAEDEFLKDVELEDEAWPVLLNLAQGDARKLLNIIELAANSISLRPAVLTAHLFQDVAFGKILDYDKSGELHYDLISAFIKSIRGSDPNAAVYYLARMTESGESIRFICRRMIISAAEDIGLANPMALVVAEAAFRAADMVGWPEARIILSECVIYLACSPKSNSAYKAIENASKTVKVHGNSLVPLHLRNAVNPLMHELGYGKGYQYSHDFEGHFTPIEFLPEELSGSTFYKPAKNKLETEFAQRLRNWWGNKYEI